jgi:hypothetical protein
MAKFETRGQIAGLFLAAGAVALLLIFLLTAEVRSFFKWRVSEELELRKSSHLAVFRHGLLQRENKE